MSLPTTTTSTSTTTTLDPRDWIRDIPDFPKPGIVFKDITPLLGHPEAFRTVIERCDVTTEFARCMAVLLVETHARRDALRALLGEADFAERLQRRVSTQGALERGLLRRETFVVA